MKQPKQYPPLPAMATDETLIGLYARTAPDVPEWYKDDIKMEDSESYQHTSKEQVFFQWRLYYANKMIELLNKK